MGAPAAAMLLGTSAAAPAAPVQFSDHSLMLQAENSAYLTRTPSQAGNRRTGAFRVRLRPGASGTKRVIWSAGTLNVDEFYIDTDDKLKLAIQGTVVLETAKLLRAGEAWAVDVGCWWDTTQANAADRFGIVFDNAAPDGGYSTDSRASIAQNTELHFHNTVVHYIGREQGGSYLDALICDPAAVDGTTAITYSEANVGTGVRDPVRPEATWGTNGFWLSLVDGSDVTSATLGKDASPRSNDWTPTNVSVSDILVDVPRDAGTDNGVGGEVRATYDVLLPYAAVDSAIALFGLPLATLAECGRRAFNGVAVNTAWLTEGVWHIEAEFHLGESSNSSFAIGTTGAESSLSWYMADGTDFTGEPFGDALVDGDIVGITIDVPNGTVAFRVNNILQGTQSPFTPSEKQRLLLLTMADVLPSAEGFSVNLGQKPFVYPAPAGAKAICSANLPAGSVVTSGGFSGNGTVVPHAVWLNGRPATLTIKGNAVTFGVHAFQTPGGFVLTTDSVDYNPAEPGVAFTATAVGPTYKTARARLT